MTAPRFFVRGRLEAQHSEGARDPRPDTVVDVPLSAGDLHHAADVLRLKAGEELTVAEPSGIVWRLRVEEVSRERLLARVLAREPAGSGVSVTLVQGVAKGPKMDRIVEQAVELGATAIVPVLTERCVVRLDESKRAERGERWRRVAEAAAKQSRREVVPRVYDPAGLEEASGVVASHDVVLVVWEETEAGLGLAHVLAESGAGPGSKVAVVIGPEGGLDAREVERLLAAGGRVCTLGRTILRTETAGLAALVLTVAALGGLGGDR